MGHGVFVGDKELGLITSKIDRQAFHTALCYRYSLLICTECAQQSVEAQLTQRQRVIAPYKLTYS